MRLDAAGHIHCLAPIIICHSGCTDNAAHYRATMNANPDHNRKACFFPHVFHPLDQGVCEGERCVGAVTVGEDMMPLTHIPA